jgi:hypothetical protein
VETARELARDSVQVRSGATPTIEAGVVRVYPLRHPRLPEPLEAEGTFTVLPLLID